MNDDNKEFSLPKDSVKLTRTQVNANPGELVYRGSELFIIQELVDFHTVIGVNPSSGRTASLLIKELSSADEFGNQNEVKVDVDLSELTEKDWDIAEHRFNVIKPLIKRGQIGRKEVTLRAKEAGVNTATIYRWIKRYKSYGLVIALAPQKPGWRKGGTRLSKDTEAVIDEVIQDYYLTQQRPSGSNVVLEVKRRCHNAGIIAPGHTAIRARIAAVSEKERLRKHGYSDKARNKFLPAPGHFPNAEYPLAVVQIDHTPLDIIVVDDEHRLPIGRPWITMAIDVYSRMVTGYYLSLDPPSETSVGMCVAHMMLPKEEWLTLHGIDADWPVWGMPQRIHVDNGADFRSNNFQKSCMNYGIELQFRPVKRPRYGGHIERLLGTFLAEIHGLPGTTFSDIIEREGYDSEKHAALTLDELEEWLVRKICKIYHRRKHSVIDMPPERRWNEGVFGTDDIPGVGLPPRPIERKSIQLDFMPSFMRTVQTFGVTIDRLRYYSEALRPWIGSKDPESGEAMKLIFRRDPRSLKVIWFYDPLLKQYFEVPFADQSKPDLSLWELRQVHTKLRAANEKDASEHRIFEALNEQRQLIDNAKEKTKKARRQAQRRKIHAKKTSPAEPKPMLAKNEFENTNAKLLGELIDNDLEGYGDIS